MKPRKLYYRRKKKSMIIEGKMGDKTTFIWTIPTPQKLLYILMENPSFFTKEKQEKIMAKIDSLDITAPEDTKPTPKVLPINIKRTFQKDYKTPVSQRDTGKRRLNQIIQSNKSLEKEIVSQTKVPSINQFLLGIKQVDIAKDLEITK